jgi:hypothetical protein
MISIRFIPIFEDKEFIDAVNEYKGIWESEAEKITGAFKKITSLSLIENRIACVVYEGISFSGRSAQDMMKLRASYDIEMKKATLIHELSHRLLFNLKTQPDMDEHQTIDLFLYDVWMDLYGEDFANKIVGIEKKRGEKYQKAWEWALSYTKDQRVEKFAEVLKENI